MDQMPTSTIQRYPPAPRNLDFAQEAAEWVLWGGAPDHYEGGVDPDVTYHNARSLFIRGKVGEPEGQAYLVQYIAADAYLGKRVRLSALLKAEAVQAWGSLCLSIQGQHENIIFNSNVQQDPKYNLRLVGSSDWQRYEIVTIVPDHSSVIGFGLGLIGAGQVCFSKPRFEIVGDEIPLTTT